MINFIATLIDVWIKSYCVLVHLTYCSSFVILTFAKNS